MSRERRRYARLYVGAEGAYTNPESQKLVKVLVQNISAVGVRFLTQELLPADFEVDFSLSLEESSPPFNARGMVRWQRKFSESFYDTGMEFLGIDRTVQERLIQRVQRSLGVVEELREFIRCSLSTTVLLRQCIDAEGAQREIRCISVDICPAGMKIISPELLSKQTHVVVSFTLPESAAQMRATGMIMWAKPQVQGSSCELGIEFEQISEYDAHQINDFVKQSLGIYW